MLIFKIIVTSITFNIIPDIEMEFQAVSWFDLVQPSLARFNILIQNFIIKVNLLFVDFFFILKYFRISLEVLICYVNIESKYL